MLGIGAAVAGLATTSGQDRKKFLGLTAVQGGATATNQLLRQWFKSATGQLAGQAVGGVAQASISVTFLTQAAKDLDAAHEALKQTEKLIESAPPGSDVRKLIEQKDRLLFQIGSASVVGGLATFAATGAAPTPGTKIIGAVSDLGLIGFTLGVGALGDRGQRFVGYHLDGAVKSAEQGIEVASKWLDEHQNTKYATSVAWDGVKYAGGKVNDAASAIGSGISWGSGKIWDGFGYVAPETQKLVGSTAADAAQASADWIARKRDELADRAFGSEAGDKAAREKIADSGPGKGTPLPPDASLDDPANRVAQARQALRAGPEGSEVPGAKAWVSV